MRQVPVDAVSLRRHAAGSAVYLIIGDGRLAHHLQAYFRFEGLHYLTTSRKSSAAWKLEIGEWTKEQQYAAAEFEQELRGLAAKATHVLLAISDSAIEPFLREHSFLQEKVCVHFSGALTTLLAASAHPLMTFAHGTYSHERYLEIPFVLEKGRGTFTELLPGLKNPSFEIESDQKVRYHALCVMSGNFTTLLWEKTFAEFAKLGLPKEVLFSYLNQITENLETAAPGTSVLTGPLVRGDKSTIEKHLVELGSDPFAEVYRSFVKAYEKSGEVLPPIRTGGPL